MHSSTTGCSTSPWSARYRGSSSRDWLRRCPTQGTSDIVPSSSIEPSRSASPPRTRSVTPTVNESDRYRSAPPACRRHCRSWSRSELRRRRSAASDVVLQLPAIYLELPDPRRNHVANRHDADELAVFDDRHVTNALFGHRASDRVDRIGRTATDHLGR